MQQITYSRGASAKDAHPLQMSAPNWDAFVQSLLADRGAAKGQQYVCAAMSDGHRCKASAQARRFVVLDFENATPEQFAALLEALPQFSALAYTTASHTDFAPRCRVFVELSMPVGRDALIATSKALRERLVLPFDETADRPEQIAYTPLHGAQSWIFNGKPLVPVLVPLARLKPVVTVIPPAHPLAVLAAHSDMERTIAKLSNAQPGERNHVLNKAAHALGGYVGAGRLARDEVRAALVAAVVAAGWQDLDKCVRTIEGGIGSGVKEPRVLVVPPLEAAAAIERAAGIYSAADLMRKTFQPVQWAIRDLLPEGVTILSGAPKVGKSWLVYGWCVAVATGTPIWPGRQPEQRGEALYLALEDNERRMARRLELVTKDMPGVDLSNLYAVHDWPRQEAGARAIADWLRKHPKCRIVVIDTLGAWRDADPGRKNAYAHDYAVGESLRPLCREFNVAIVVVAHTRKMQSSDYMQMVSGTNGLTGSMDNVLVLERGRGDDGAVLHVDGRDIENAQEAALRLIDGRFHYVGQAQAVARSKERSDVLDALRTLGVATAKQVHEAMDVPTNYGTLRSRLSRMAKSGELIFANGLYSMPSLPEPPKIDPPVQNFDPA